VPGGRHSLDIFIAPVRGERHRLQTEAALEKRTMSDRSACLIAKTEFQSGISKEKNFSCIKNNVLLHLQLNG
jgi:hypothetical protein